jgi:Chaperone of endosialidase
MKPSIRLKTIPPLLITLTLHCFGLLPRAQAVVPPPDGGYPNFTTAEGTKALQSLTTGSANNAAFGAAALLFNTGGTNNTAVGASALLHNTIAEENTATGAFALSSNTEGDFNTANGAWALFFNTIGVRNTATGDSALYSNTTGNQNTATGNAALVVNTTGGGNTANGRNALSSNTTGSNNTATGVNALLHNTIGEHNTANGFNALLSNTSGIVNTAMGNQTLQSNTTGSSNTALGNGAGNSVTTADNAIGTAGANVSDSCYIGNIWDQPGGSQAVYVNSDGKLGAQVSSRRFKTDIKPINQASEVIHRLRPVSFRYKAEVESRRPVGFGLIAEEVEKINPDLVSRDRDGKPFTVRYEAVNAMLLNEFLNEHRAFVEQQQKVEEQGATIARQQRQIEVLTAAVQKVSAQLATASPPLADLR